MPIILAELENLQAVGKTGKPKYVVKGRRRKILKKAYAELQSLVRQDNQESLRAERQGYTPFFCTGEPASDDWHAVLEVIQRLNQCILAKV